MGKGPSPHQRLRVELLIEHGFQEPLTFYFWYFSMKIAEDSLPSPPVF